MSNAKQLEKMASVQFKQFQELAKKDIKLKVKDIKFKEKFNQKLFDKLRAFNILILKQYVIVEKLYSAAKKKHITINDSKLTKLRKEWKFIKTQLLPKFNNSRATLASYLAVQRMGLSSLTKSGASALYETTLKQEHKLAKALKSMKVELKKQYPKLKLEESTEVLTEADIKKIITAPFRAIKNAVKAVFSALIEGWLFTLKSLGKVAEKISSVIKLAQKKFEGQVGRAVELILKQINPDFLETMGQIAGGTDQIREDLGSLVTKGIFAITAFITGAGIVQAGALAYYSTTTILDKMATAGEFADTGEALMDLMKEMNSDYFDDLMNDLE